jgi:hypothetical protein
MHCLLCKGGGPVQGWVVGIWVLIGTIEINLSTLHNIEPVAKRLLF